MWSKFLNKGLSSEAIDTISCSLSDSTQRQYRSSFNQWVKYCCQTNSDPLTISPVKVISFFQHLLDPTNITYNSFVTHRAALSLISPHDLSQDCMMSRFLKGVFRRRPPAPKHESSWDPTTVLNYLEICDDSSFSFLSKKLLTLMLLASAQRLQTMAAIDIRNIRFSMRGVTIWVDSLLKTSRPGSKELTLHFANLPTQPHLCIPSVLKDFLKLSATLRGPTVNTLFLTTTTPYRPATTPTLARWAKHILSCAGIDIQTFTAHSTRHSAVSCAARSGVSMDAIFKAAGWSHSSKMFAQVYNRPLQDPFHFSMAIMNN